MIDEFQTAAITLACTDHQSSFINLQFMPDFRFPQRLRLLKPREFERVMRSRVSATDALVRMYGAANELNHPRLGLTVSRRVGGAVWRNVWKRAIREAFRLAQRDLPACDLVCIPQRDAEPNVARLIESIGKLSQRIERELRRRGNP
jgi:ribonuclease P protein component